MPADPGSDELAQSSSPPDEVLVGVVEDDRVRAVVTARADEIQVVLEGDLDGSVNPIIDDLLAAVRRWGRGASRSTGGAFTGRAADRGGARPAGGAGRASPARGGGRLLLDASRVGAADDSTWRMLARHQRWWTHERGPCVVRRP